MPTSRALAAASIALALSSCGPRTPQEQGSTYQPSHTLLSPGNEGLLAKVHRSQITICIDGMTPTEPWAQWTRSAILKWIAPLRTMAGQTLASSVRYVSTTAACATADAKVKLHPATTRGTAYTRAGRKPTIVLYRSDPRNGRVVLHEMGHAFGLGDTYYGPGWERQPNSVMKTAGYEQLQPDDIAGIKRLYRRLNPAL